MIIFMANIGFALTKLEIFAVIKNYLIESGQDEIFENNEPTDRWYYALINICNFLSDR